MRFLLLISLLVLCDPSFAYPIRYRCHADKTLSFLPPESTAPSSEKCGCRDEFAEVVRLLGLGTQITRNLTSPEDPALSELASSSSQQCFLERHQGNWSSTLKDKYLVDHKGTKHLVITSLYRTPYHFPTGHRLDKAQRPKHILPLEMVKKLIRESIRFEVDPYYTLAIYLMEGEVNPYVDPQWLSKEYGCTVDVLPNKKCPNGQPSISETSYGSFYNICPKVIKEKEYQSTLVRKSIWGDIEHEEYSANKNTKYYCIFKRAISNDPLPKDCCLEITFPVSTTESLELGLYMHHLKSKLKKPVENDPTNPCGFGLEGRVQSFNGCKGLGFTEALAVNMFWRNGVLQNGKDNSQIYAYQALSFIGDLWENPYLTQLIKETKQELQLPNPPNLLCIDQPEGVYTYDQDSFQKKLCDAPRLKFTKNKPSWSSLTPSEQKIIDIEYKAIQMRYRLERESHFDLTKCSFRSVALSESKPNLKYYQRYVKKLCEGKNDDAKVGDIIRTTNADQIRYETLLTDPLFKELTTVGGAMAYIMDENNSYVGYKCGASLTSEQIDSIRNKLGTTPADSSP